MNDFPGGGRRYVTVPAGIHRVIVKPFRLLEVEGIVKGAIRESELEQQNTRLLAELKQAVDTLQAREKELENELGGKVMEAGPRDRLFIAPRHPYTHALLAAVPIADPQIERRRARSEVRSEPPDPADPPFMGPCECAFLVAKQFTFHKVGRQTRQVHRHQWMARARAELMDGTGDQLFARPAFARH